MKSIIDIKNLTFSYGAGAPVLHDISLSVKKGEFVAVLGYNGSGKSTFAKLINGILVPSSGRVLVNGLDTSDENHIFDIRRSVGMVFQNPDNQIVASTVEEDVAFALENLGVDYSEMRARVDDSLDAVGISEYKNSSPNRLSGGQKQRVAIAGILAMRPDCIILDEPTAMLDPKGRSQIMETVKRLHKDFGITVILITHFMEEAAEADRVVVLSGGRVVIDDAPRNVFSKAELMNELGLGVPPVTELALELRRLGIDIPNDTIHPDEIISYLVKIGGRGF